MDTQTEMYFIEHLKTALAPDQSLVSTHRNNILSIVNRLDRDRCRQGHRRRSARRGAQPSRGLGGRGGAQA